MKARGLLHLAIVALSLFTRVAPAHAATATFAIDPQDLSGALKAFAVQCHREIFFAPELARGKKSHGVNGKFDDLEALDIILKGTDLGYSVTASDAILLRDLTAAADSDRIPSAPTTSELNGPSEPKAQLTQTDSTQSRTLANTNIADSKESDTTKLEEIIVSAQKRSESLSKVPLSISAISAKDLQEEHITNFADLSQAVPNVSFTSQGGPGLSTIEIRGVSSEAGTAAVGVYLNDVSLTTRNLYSQGTAEPRFFDLDHVEALRGPQGTLYGGGTLGGVVRFIEKKPNLHDFDTTDSVEGSQTRHGGTNYNVESVVNLPLIDGKVALRLGAQEGEDSGYIDQVSGTNLAVLAKGINGNRWTVGKAALLWQITDTWSAMADVFYQKYTTHDIDATFGSVPYNQPLAGTELLRLETTKTVREPATDTLTIPSITINGDLGFADLSIIGSSYQRDFARIQDGTIVNVPYLASLFPAGSPAAIGISALNSVIDLTTQQRQKSVELRLASKAYSPESALPITWLAGAFYLDNTTQVFDNEPVVGITHLFKQLGLNPNDPSVFPGSFPGAWPADDSSYFSHRYYNPTQMAVFGDVDYYFVPAFHATVGVRYESAKESFYRGGNYYYTGCGAADALGNPQTCPLQYVPPDAYFHATTPRVAFTWDISDANLVYASASKGYREGSFNIPVPLYGPPTGTGTLADLASLGLCDGTAARCQHVIPTAFKPDSLWSYELGSKSRLFDDRLSIAASVYYLRWKNTQQDIFLVTSFYQYEANAGDVQSYGAELDIKARPTRDLTLTLSGGYNQATFSDNVPALGGNSGVLNVSKGAKVPGVPAYNALLSGEYRFRAGPVDGFIRGDARFVGTSRGTFVIGAPDYYRPSYFTSDASGGVNFGPTEVSLFVKNLNNGQKILQRPNIQTVVEGFTQRPRTIGLNVTYRYANR